MKTFEPITRADQPAWYELSFNARRASLILRVNREFVQTLEFKATDESPIVKAFREEFGFKQFDGSFEQDLGFDRSFRLERHASDGFDEFICKLPRVKKETGELCKDCGGSGKDWKAYDRRCFDCRGTGKRCETDWRQARAISASLSVFFGLARRPHWGDSSPPAGVPGRFQLLTVQTITVRDMHGGSLVGMFSIPLVRLLRCLPSGTHFKTVEDAMIVAHNRMFGLKRYERHDFRAWMSDDHGRLVLDCPGKNCCIHPDGWPSPDLKQGYDFTCHNVDTPMQQLTLIAGLAALCDEARKKYLVE